MGPNMAYQSGVRSKWYPISVIIITFQLPGQQIWKRSSFSLSPRNSVSSILITVCPFRDTRTVIKRALSLRYKRKLEIIQQRMWTASHLTVSSVSCLNCVQIPVERFKSVTYLSSTDMWKILCNDARRLLLAW